MRSIGSVEHARLVRRNHVLDVDVRVISSMALKHFQRLLDQIPQVLALSLAVVDSVATVYCRRTPKPLFLAVVVAAVVVVVVIIQHL